MHQSLQQRLPLNSVTDLRTGKDLADGPVCPTAHMGEENPAAGKPQIQDWNPGPKSWSKAFLPRVVSFFFFLAADLSAL